MRLIDGEASGQPKKHTTEAAAVNSQALLVMSDSTIGAGQNLTQCNFRNQQVPDEALSWIETPHNSSLGLFENECQTNKPVMQFQYLIILILVVV